MGTLGSAVPQAPGENQQDECNLHSNDTTTTRGLSFDLLRVFAQPPIAASEVGDHTGGDQLWPPEQNLHHAPLRSTPSRSALLLKSQISPPKRLLFVLYLRWTAQERRCSVEELVEGTSAEELLWNAARVAELC